MIRYPAIHRQTMLLTVNEALRHGLHLGTRLELNLDDYELALVEPRACFITLKIDNKLRGCMGSLTANQALIENIAHNAYNAAFKDPRFSPLSKAELSELDIEISILSDSVPIPCRNEQELIEQLIPGRDGLILDDGEHCATFLPSVWEQLADPQSFVAQLKLKAGLDEGEWNPNIKASRYIVSNVSKNRARRSA